MANVDVAHGTPGAALASAGSNAKLRHGAPASRGVRMSFCSVNRGTTFL